MQLAFELDAPLARARDPETSKAAAVVARKKQAADACLILGALRQGPAIVDRLAEITGRPAHALGKRLPELHDARAIRLTGRKLQGASGTPQREWELCA